MIRRPTSVAHAAGQKANAPHDESCSEQTDSTPTEKSDEMREADIANGEAVESDERR